MRKSHNSSPMPTLLYSPMLMIVLISIAHASSSDESAIILDIGSQPDPQFQPNFPQFKVYVQEFEKGYQAGTVEYKTRQEIYNGWKDYWMQKYNNGELTYLVGATQHSDWTKQERQKTKPESKQEPLGQEDKIKLQAKVSQKAGNAVKLDWRDHKVVTKVKNQGKCGSCWTFATAAYGESRMIKKDKANINIDLSEQYLLSCTPDCDCEGGYLEYVFEEAGNGIPTEDSYPYNPYGLVSPFICWTDDKETIGYIPNKAYDLSTSQLESLLQDGPLAISVSATNWDDYKGGIFKCNSYDKVNHAVLLVGYDQNSWIIKNQWGEKWGENGYIRVTKDRARNCKVGASAFWMWESTQTFTLIGMLFVLIAFQF